MDRSSSVLLALSSRDIGEGTAPLKARELWTLIQASHDQGASLSAFLSDDEAWRAGVPAELHEPVVARLRLSEDVQGLVAELQGRGFWISTPFEETWPDRLRTRLKNQSPALLYGAGDASLLAEDGIGIVGSRNLTAEGEEVARRLAAVAVEAGMAVVSGGARGVDQIAMSAALENGGRAVGVLAHPLDRTMRESSTATALEDEMLCLTTPFKPDAGFSVGNAMARNKLIYGLSRATAVVAADRDAGGTWSGATEALERGFGAVAIWRGPGEGAGNERLAARPGATSITDPSQLLSIAPSVERQPSLLSVLDARDLGYA